MEILRPGKRAELRAAWWYRMRGYRVLAMNEWVGGYELDLVLRRGRRLLFCEVKEKASAAFGRPEEMVDHEKQRRLRRAAAAWLARHPDAAGLNVSFEVVAIEGGRLRRVTEAF
jgi:putative endonuclease